MPTKTADKTETKAAAKPEPTKAETPRKPTHAEAEYRAVLDVEAALEALEEEDASDQSLPSLGVYPHTAGVRQQHDFFDAFKFQPQFRALLAHAHLGAIERERS